MKKQDLFFLLFLLLTCAFSVKGESDSTEPNTLAWMKAHYEKKECMIPMRDGIHLYTAVYFPRNIQVKRPILMMRTPYGCGYYGAGNYEKIYQDYMSAYLQLGYILVKQDVRGRYRSEGIFENIRPLYAATDAKACDEATDVYDTIDWLLRNFPQNNGCVGLLGNSYPGLYALMGGLSQHPAIKAISPQAPVTDWFIGDDWHQHGAFKLMDAFHFFNGFGKPSHGATESYGPTPKHYTTDEYTFFLQQQTIAHLSRYFGDTISFWPDMLRHPHYDSWWKERCSLNHCNRLEAATLVVGGFFDAEDSYGAFTLYECLKQSGKKNLFLAAGPWSHGQWRRSNADHLGNLSFGSNTAAYFQQQIEIPFFEYYLDGKTDKALPAPASILISGTNKQAQFDSWPPKNQTFRTLYLSAYAPGDGWGTLSFDKPLHASYSQYVSDPAHPVPYVDRIATRRNAEYMTADQRFASRRPDVLTYVSEPLQAPLTVAGKVGVQLKVKLTTEDADLIIKLIDVYPDQTSPESEAMDGYQLLVRGEVMRGRYRHGYTHPVSFKPNQTESVEWQTVDVAHTFRPGHRLMVQIQSTWFPLIDRNPQQMVNPYTCEPSDFIPCTVSILEGGEHASTFVLPVIP